MRAYAARRLQAAALWDSGTRPPRGLLHGVGPTAPAPGCVAEDEFAWTDRVMADLDDFRHAFRWLLDHERVGDALALVAPIARLGWLYPSTGIHRWVDEVVSQPGAREHPLAPAAAEFEAAALANTEPRRRAAGRPRRDGP